MSISKILVFLVTALALADAARAAPTVGQVDAPASVGLYNKFEASFAVTTAATNYYWPYDPSPACNTEAHPNAVAAGVGVSVDGLFLPPGASDWSAAIFQPGFYYQPYIRNDDYVSTQTWLVPSGSPVWKIRFAPTLTGTWKFKIRVIDASGTIESPEYSFTCNASQNHGFIRVSPNDGRYFELTDGTYVPLIGMLYESRVLKDTERVLAQFNDMGVNLIRAWWQGSSPAYPLFGAGGQGGDSVWNNLSYSSAYVRPGYLVSAVVPRQSGIFDALWKDMFTEPGHKYRLKATVKTVGITGAGDYGARLQVLGESNLSPRISGTTDWTDTVLDFTARFPLTAISIGQQNVTDGQAYCAEISLKEDIGGGQYGPEIVSRPDFAAHQRFPQNVGYLIDHLLETAAQNGVYVKAVAEEKGDFYFGSMQADGTWGSRSDANVYADATHASRTYQQYYWRYLIARWGYSTALHSLEFCNEGDPNSVAHKDAIIAMANYFRTNDPNRRLVSSSNWHSFPPDMWRDPAISYADIHMYLGWSVPGGGSRLWPGWDGSWAMSNSAGDPNDPGISSGFEWDTTTAHTGTRSLKMTIPPVATTYDWRYKESNPWFGCGAPPNHTIRIRFWAKSQNTVGYDYLGNLKGAAGLGVQYSMAGGDFAGYTSGTGSTAAPWGTYDWSQVEYTFTVPTSPLSGAQGRLPLICWVHPYIRATNSSSPGYVWIDDVVIEDLTAATVINYNGGFENITPESFDIVAGHCAYSRIARGFSLGKPVIRGEASIVYPQRFANPYKGFTYHIDDQLLVDDTEGVWWKKLVWAHLDPGGLIEIYWENNLPIARAFAHGKAYQNFLADIPLSNGRYVDADAAVSDLALRALGQRDRSSNRAHLWIDNSRHTWKNVVDNVTIPPVSGTVTVSGLANGNYKVEWWNTSSGQIIRTEDAAVNGGALTLSVTDLQSDIACKIYPAPANISLRLIVPSTDVIPGQLVTVTVEYTNDGQSEARDAVVSTHVPALMDYVAGSAEASGGYYDAATKTVTWTVPTVGANQTGTRTFQARVQ